MKENSFEKVFYLSYKDLLYVLRLLIHSIDCPDVCAFESKILQQVENGSLLHYIIHMHSSFVLFFPLPFGLLIRLLITFYCGLPFDDAIGGRVISESFMRLSQ